jgi:hypothetical protein
MDRAKEMRAEDEDREAAAAAAEAAYHARQGEMTTAVATRDSLQEAVDGINDDIAA